MSKRSKHIPVNTFQDKHETGISIKRIIFNDVRDLEGHKRSERHNWHSFHLLEKGIITIEIDFERYEMSSPSLIYMHPNQVHRMISSSGEVVVNSWMINNEKINAEYLKLLEDITPVKPLYVNEETLLNFDDTISVALTSSERKNNPLYSFLLKDYCNALVCLVISHYLNQSTPTDKFPRFTAITKAFNKSLQHNFIELKRPTEYAQKLNISTAYLNECVKNKTGYPISYHIQQRNILEAKRLLYYSDKSVKEIAFELGYDNYPYFTRLFTNNVGITPTAFRNKNRD